MDDTIEDRPPEGSAPERFAQVVDNMSIGYLAIMLALAGLGGAWRDADRSWQPSETANQWIQFAAGIVWTALVAVGLVSGLLTRIRLIRSRPTGECVSRTRQP